MTTCHSTPSDISTGAGIAGLRIRSMLNVYVCMYYEEDDAHQCRDLHQHTGVRGALEGKGKLLAMGKIGRSLLDVIDL